MKLKVPVNIYRGYWFDQVTKHDWNLRTIILIGGDINALVSYIGLADSTLVDFIFYAAWEISSIEP